MCKETSTNLRLDTGYLDSHTDFGLNTIPNQRILWRNALHCAPVATKGFTGSGNITSLPSLGNLTFYNYGPLGDNPNGINHTYAAQDVESQYARLLSSEIFITSGDYLLE